MGSWGFHPMDSDDAMDRLGLVEDAASLMLQSMLCCSRPNRDPMHAWSTLGVVEVLLDRQFSLHERVVKEAAGLCEWFINNGDDFFEEFTQPEECVIAIRKLYDRLSGITKEPPFGILRAMNKGMGPTAQKP